jgi:hypothetical protein
VEGLGLRIGAGATLAVVASSGLFLSDKMGRDSRARVEQLATHAVTAEEVRDEANARRATAAYDPAAFAANIAADAKGFAVETSLLELGDAQAFKSVLQDPVVLGPGQSWASDQFSAKASHEKVQYQQHGAMISAKHAVLTLHNVSRTPVAYFIRARSHDRGSCEVRGARMHNAMALMPDEKAEIVVCAGGGKVRIDELLVLETSPLGYMYMSQVPPSAVGHDGITTTAHTPIKRVETCRDIDSKGIAGRIRDGLTRWVDVADFYTRHNCHRFGFSPSYHYTGTKIERLPYAE